MLKVEDMILKICPSTMVIDSLESFIYDIYNLGARLV